MELFCIGLLVISFVMLEWLIPLGIDLQIERARSRQFAQALIAVGKGDKETRAVVVAYKFNGELNLPRNHFWQFWRR